MFCVGFASSSFLDVLVASQEGKRPFETQASDVRLFRLLQWAPSCSACRKQECVGGKIWVWNKWFLNIKIVGALNQNLDFVMKVAKITGEEWKNMTDTQKAPYEKVSSFGVVEICVFVLYNEYSF